MKSLATKLYKVVFLLIVVVCLSEASDVEAQVQQSMGITSAGTTSPVYVSVATSSDLAFFLNGTAWNTSGGFSNPVDFGNLDATVPGIGSNATVTIMFALDGTVPLCGTAPSANYNCWFGRTQRYFEFYKNSGVWTVVAPPAFIDLSASTTYQSRIESVEFDSTEVPSGEPDYVVATGDFVYTRSGYATSSTNAITFDVHLNNDTPLGGIVSSSDFWGLEIYGDGVTTFNQQVGCVAVGEMDLNVTVSLPAGNYTGVGFGGDVGTCEGSWSDNGSVEPEPYTGGTVFTVFQGVFETTISAQYFINTDEIVSTISVKNPTSVSFSLSKRPDTTSTTQGETIDNTVTGTGTVSTTFDSLTDGTYDVLVKFSNVGCSIGQSSCPFPLAYIYTYFVLEDGAVTTVGENEVYDNTVAPASISQYEDCGLSNLSGCFNNSLRFLFIPSEEVINDLVVTKDELDTKIPFVYVSDIQTVMSEIFNTEQSETLDVELDLGFGTVTLIDESMIANAPQASTIRTLLSYILWITFALGAYRMALGIHNKETT